MNKKAISPLIATVLLIGFAVALAAVVMTWGGGFIRSTTESTEKQAEQTLLCATQLNFDVKIKTDCSGVIIDNKCNLKIKNILLKVDKGNTIETKEKFIENIDPYNVGENSLDLNGVKEITAIATLEDGTVCSEGRSTTVPSNCGSAA